MSLDTYTIRCARGHEPVELTGQAAVDHGEACMGRKVGYVWAENAHGNLAPMAWKPATAFKPFPWKAPKWTASAQARIEADIKSGVCSWESLDADDESAA